MNISPSADACTMFLVRHGATENNLADPPVLQGNSLDGGLSQEGRAQAESATRFLASYEIAAAYCSHLKRARETAQLIAAPHNIEVEPVDNIQEVNVGDWEGRSWVEIAVTEKERYEQFMTRPDVHGYAGGENLTQVRDRVVPVLTKLMQQNMGNLILVVGHNVVNRCMLADAMGLPLAKARDVVQSNCGVNVLRLKDGAVQVRTLNSAFHLA